MLVLSYRVSVLYFDDVWNNKDSYSYKTYPTCIQ